MRCWSVCGVIGDLPREALSVTSQGRLGVVPWVQVLRQPRIYGRTESLVAAAASCVVPTSGSYYSGTGSKRFN